MPDTKVATQTRGSASEVADGAAHRLTARDPRLDTWRAFLTAHALLTRRLDEDLRAENGLTLGEYSALLQVAEAPDRSLRMNQLADGILLSRSGVTRLIDRLEADGLIARSTCTEDGRGSLAVLTEAGLDRLRAAAGTHLRGIDQYFLSIVPDAELDHFQITFRAIAERVRREGDATIGEAACDPVTATELVARAPAASDQGRG
jgi:DNA-binding MarR family transcriptional regulator